MGDLLYQQARDAVARTELLALSAETDTQLEAVQKEMKRAKNALLSAYANSTPAQQEQLMIMQDHLSSINNTMSDTTNFT